MNFISQQKNISKNSGYAALMSVLFFVFISLAVLLGLVSPTIRNFQNTRLLLNSKASFLLANSGAEDYYYRLTSSMPINSNCDFSTGRSEIGCISLVLGDNEVESIIAETGSVRTITSSARVSSVDRVIEMILNGGSVPGLIFEKGGMSVLSGGATLGSGTISNLYSNGPILGSGLSSVLSSMNYSAGASGLINNVSFSNKIFANTVSNSTGVGRAEVYYQNLNSTTAFQYFPNSPDPELMAGFPISDEIVSAFKNDASLGGEIGTYPCDYDFSSGGNIGPKKINCNVNFNAGTYIINGPLWIRGNITLNPGVLIYGQGDQNIPIIADNELNRTTSSKIFWNTSEQFSSTGSLFISMNESASLGGNEKAIVVTTNHSNSGEKIYLYAPKGLISFENGVLAEGVLSASYKVNVQDGSNVSFGQGVDYPIQLDVSSDSYGSWAISSWGEAD